MSPLETEDVSITVRFFSLNSSEGEIDPPFVVIQLLASVQNLQDAGVVVDAVVVVVVVDVDAVVAVVVDVVVVRWRLFFWSGSSIVIGRSSSCSSTMLAISYQYSTNSTTQQ